MGRSEGSGWDVQIEETSWMGLGMLCPHHSICGYRWHSGVSHRQIVFGWKSSATHPPLSMGVIRHSWEAGRREEVKARGILCNRRVSMACFMSISHSQMHSILLCPGLSWQCQHEVRQWWASLASLECICRLDRNISFKQYCMVLSNPTKPFQFPQTEAAERAMWMQAERPQRVGMPWQKGESVCNPFPIPFLLMRLPMLQALWVQL